MFLFLRFLALVSVFMMKTKAVHLFSFVCFYNPISFNSEHKRERKKWYGRANGTS